MPPKEILLARLHQAIEIANKKERLEITSAIIADINYLNEKKILEIKFKTGREYHFFDVPESIWEDYKKFVESSKSAAAFFNSRIKGFYEFKEVGS